MAKIISKKEDATLILKVIRFFKRDFLNIFPLFQVIMSRCLKNVLLYSKMYGVGFVAELKNNRIKFKKVTLYYLPLILRFLHAGTYKGKIYKIKL